MISRRDLKPFRSLFFHFPVCFFGAFIRRFIMTVHAWFIVFTSSSAGVALWNAWAKPGQDAVWFQTGFRRRKVTLVPSYVLAAWTRRSVRRSKTPLTVWDRRSRPAMSAFFLRVGAFRCSAPLEELGLPGLATRRKLRRNLYFSKALQQKFPSTSFADSETR
jgi:hypothetical protein